MQIPEITYQMSYYEADNLAKKLRAVVLKLQQMIDTLRQRIQEARRAINYFPSDCKAQIDSLQSRIRSYERQIQDLNNQIRYIEELINDLSNLVSTTQSVDLFLRDQIMNVFRTGGGFSSQYLPGYIPGMPTSLYEKILKSEKENWINEAKIIEDINANMYNYLKWGFEVSRPFLDIKTGHLGLDLYNGDNIRALFSGKVVGMFNGCKSNSIYEREKFPNGNRIVIEHNINGVVFYSSYCHLKQNGFPQDLKIGDDVDAKELIGIMGNTGYSTDVHLHLAIFTGPKSTNPIGYKNNMQGATFTDLEDDGGTAYASRNDLTGRTFFDPEYIMKNGIEILLEYERNGKR